VLGNVIRAESHGYVLAIPETQVDACRFEAAVSAAEGIDPVAGLEILDEVLPLWRGRPYADVDGFGLLDPEITRLTELRIRALEDRAETALQLGRHRQLVEELEALVLENPLSESFRAQLMLALYRSGRQAEALRVAADARTFFGRELGLDPPPLVRVLEQQVIDQDPALDYRPRPRRAGLPARYSSFVGREEVLEAIVGALERRRLVLVTGAGGLGKTRVAVEAATRRSDSSGAVFVDVESTRPGEVASVVARALGLPQLPGQDPSEAIEAVTASGDSLLILDGCEHLTDEVGALVDRVLRAGPGWRVLVTSRIPLGMSGELSIDLGPMGTGPGSEAVELFCDRGGITVNALNEAEREAVHHICSRLDGFPLAIEIAASKIRSMTLERMAHALDRQVELLSDRSRIGGRHTSLRAALDWSYQLLDEELGRAFRWLAVFTSGIPSEAADALLGADRAPVLLSALVRASLVAPPDRGGRYRMLEPVRQYALELLEDSGELEEAREVHARWAVALAEQLRRSQFTPPIGLVYRRARVERAELMEAMRWLLSSGRPQPALVITASLGRVWVLAGEARHVKGLVTSAIEHPDVAEDDLLARATAAVAWIHEALGDFDRAEELIARALRLAGQTSDHDTLFEVLGRAAAIPSGILPSKPFDPATALDLWERAMVHGVRIGYPAEAMEFNRAIFLAGLGRIEEAEAAIGRMRDWMLESGTAAFQANLILGGIAEVKGDIEEAIRLYQLTASESLEAGDWINAVDGLTNAAHALDLVGRDAEASAEVERAVELCAATGMPPVKEIRPLTHARIAANRSDWEGVFEGLRNYLVAAGLGRTNPSAWHAELTGSVFPAHRPGVVGAMEPLARSLVHLGRLDQAATLAAAAPALIRDGPSQHWAGLGQGQFWAELAAEVGPPMAHFPETLEELYDWMTRTVNSEPLSLTVAMHPTG
jgi:predicted ATPase